MTLLASGSLVNIHGSLDKYLLEQLTFADGTPIALRLHGVRLFTPPVDAPWVEADYSFLGLQQVFRRQTGQLALDVTPDNSIYATERQGQLQLNTYQRARVFATRYTTAAVRDRIVQAFPDGGIVPVYDIAGGNDVEPINQFLLDGLQEHIQDTGLQSGIIQHVIRVHTRYLESYTRVGG
jgi:hypothetical protein